jgi:hypothetical protein
MESDMSEHIWSQENLESYAAGGLTAQERERFERHAAECANCARDLAEWHDVENRLESLFAEVRPETGLEDRMIQTLRRAPLPRRFFRSTIVRFALSAAAVVMLGVIGAGLCAFSDLDDLVFPGEGSEWGWASGAKPQIANNLKELVNGTTDHGMHYAKGEYAVQDPLNTDDIDPNARMENNLVTKSDLRQLENTWGRNSVAGQKQAGESANRPTWFSRHSQAAGDKAPITAPIKGRVDSLRQLAELAGRLENEEVRAGAPVKRSRELHGRNRDQNEYRLGDALEGRPPGADATKDRSFERQTASLQKRLEAVDGERAVNERLGFGFSIDGRRTGAVSDAPPQDRQDMYQRGAISDLTTDKNAAISARTAPVPAERPPEAAYFQMKSEAWALKSGGEQKLAEEMTATIRSQQAEGKESTKLGAKVAERAPHFGVPPPVNAPDRGTVAMGGLVSQKAEAGEPAKLGRKIIRTGEIEFEIDSFDNAVDRINSLINATKGAFIATTNSDKLPNGKVKGSVVVRMPPENLDKFLLDLRKDLGKIGELKSQRIGSSDITKQYTDIESRLKAARTMEERLLKIIQTGKGEVKDLVAAERELGNWRTKIEEMEGEIRYYNNQISLSTLTINLFEKEIRAPSALVITERITMRIETEEVEKGQQAAVKAVLDAKGRVTKSELKQHAAGQLEAIVTAEVAPAAADGLRTRFRQLGVVTKLDSDRLQQAVGGTGNLGEIKTRQNDVQFNLTLYNVANIQPRETFNIQVATLDVPAGFRKLQDVVGKAKGQVRKGQLNEQDKLNVTAEFDFDIPSQERKTIDKALEEAGRIISRSTAQAPPGETVTESKVGYRLVLRNVAGIAPREKVTLAIEVKDVEKTAEEFISLVRAQQGTVAAARDNQEPSGKITALLLFDVPLSAKDKLVSEFKTAGRIRLRQTTSNPQVPDNDLATAHLDVTLSSTGPIVPSDEGLWPQIRTSLFYSFKMLSWSVMFIILGLAVVVPWALVIWGIYRVVRRMRGKTGDVTS